MSNSSHTPYASDDAPMTNFSHCHDGIIGQLSAMADLSELAVQAERARTLADKTRHFFRDVVFEHHQEEEKVLFDAVLRSAEDGAERDHVRSVTERLTHEHRQFEALWYQLEPQLKKMAKGQACDLDIAAVQRLIQQYGAHAAFEEAEFLPLAEAILSRNSSHMAAMGLSLHMRHVTLTSPYI